MKKISRDSISIHESYLLAGPSVLWFGVFLLIPLGVISYYSFLTYSSFSIEHTFTLKPWISVITSDTIRQVLVETLFTGAVVTLITLVFGYPLAYYLRFYTSQNGGIILLLFLIIPFWTSGVIRTLGWIPVLGKEGVINQVLLLVGIIDQPLSWLLFSPVSQILGYLQNYVVFMAAPIYIALTQVDEGLLDADADFFFLEVNTRIQVEHTVTEEITDVDIVKWQIRVAADEELSFSQDDVDVEGHAMEFRINAENAANDFAPATGGEFEVYDPPGGIGVRVDDAPRQGDDLVTDYDSMVAKLITYGGDREECVARGKRALGDYDIQGFPTIIPFHRLMLTDDTFLAGEHTTKYIDETLDHDRIDTAQERWGTEPAESDDEDEKEVVEREFTVEVNGKRFQVELEERGAPAIPVGDIDASGSGGQQPRPGRPDSSGGDGGDGGTSAEGEEIAAEMQGTILEVNVAESDEVGAGDVLCVLEAMKMENDIVAERGGTVTHVGVSEGESVDMGDTLFVLD